MSADLKKCYKLFTLTDYEKEEVWLREMANQGWMLKDVKICRYTFERIKPADIVFKLDFQDTKNQPDDAYLQMLEDYGWNYLMSMNNYRYLYKSADVNEAENEIYTDNASKYDMLNRIVRFKFLPVMCIFLLIVIPGFMRAVEGEYSSALNIFWILIMALYVVIFVKLGLGYRHLFQKYRTEE